MSMNNVYYNLVINGVIEREKVPYKAVLIETRLKDTVGLNQTNWVEWFPPQVVVEITAEQIKTGLLHRQNTAVRRSRHHLAISAMTDDAKICVGLSCKRYFSTMTGTINLHLAPLR